jgi:hypothetical protein
MIVAMETSFIFDSGSEDGAVMWKTCLPFRLERRDEVFEDGGGCLFATLKPVGGL